MAVKSMTGFARAAGSGGGWRWAFEIKSVNAKGLDLRLRMPAPFDRVEVEARARLAKALLRGTCFATLTAQREGAVSEPRIDQAALEAIAAAARAAAERAGLAPPTMDGLLALRGVVEMADAPEDEQTVRAACAGALLSLDEALAALGAARQSEGRALAAVLRERLDAVAALTEAADANPARRPEAVRARLAQSVAALMDPRAGSTRTACIRRRSCLPPRPTFARNSTGSRLMSPPRGRSSTKGGAIGRRLDFLAQELGGRPIRSPPRPMT